MAAPSSSAWRTTRSTRADLCSAPKSAFGSTQNRLPSTSRNGRPPDNAVCCMPQCSGLPAVERAAGFLFGRHVVTEFLDARGERLEFRAVGVQALDGPLQLALN